MCVVYHAIYPLHVDATCFWVRQVLCHLRNVCRVGGCFFLLRKKPYVSALQSDERSPLSIFICNSYVFQATCSSPAHQTPRRLPALTVTSSKTWWLPRGPVPRRTSSQSFTGTRVHVHVRFGILTRHLLARAHPFITLKRPVFTIHEYIHQSRNMVRGSSGFSVRLEGAQPQG